MSSIKDTRIAKLIGGKGAYITFAAAIVAAIGAGGMAYARAINSAENEVTFSYLDSSDIDSDTNAAAVDKKQSGVLRTEAVTELDSSVADSSMSTESKPMRVSADLMPVNGEILNPFSNGQLVKSDTLGVWRTHDGVDIKAKTGTPVRAMNAGEVTQVSKDPLWGCTVVIDHGNGIVAYYYNLSTAVAVKEGEIVQAGQTIGAVGDTAEIEAAMESHLHFAIKRNGEWIDPINYISPKSK